MLLKNNAKRLITINGGELKDGKYEKSYQILPGDNPAVEVPSELCNTVFVKTLIDTGNLLVVGGLVEPEGDPTKPDLPNAEDPTDGAYDSMTKAELFDACEVAGIETNSRDTKESLIAKLS